MHHIEAHRTTVTLNRKNLFALLGAFGIVLGFVFALASAKPQAATGGCRIGTYDSRAVAVAYIRSAEFSQQMKDLQRQRAEAVKAGDKKRTEELDARANQCRFEPISRASAPRRSTMCWTRCATSCRSWHG